MLAPTLTAVVPGVFFAAGQWVTTWSRSGRTAGLATTALVTLVGTGLAIRLVIWRGVRFRHVGLILMWVNLIETGALWIATMWAAFL